MDFGGGCCAGFRNRKGKVCGPPTKDTKAGVLKLVSARGAIRFFLFKGICSSSSRLPDAVSTIGDRG